MIERLEPRRLLDGLAADVSWGVGGKTVVDQTGPLADSVVDASLDSLGRTVALVTQGDASTVHRYTPGGNFDSTFDGDGKRSIESAANERALSIGIDGQGRLTVLSRIGNASRVTRFSSGGAIDSSFAVGGSALLASGNSFDNILVFTDGSFLLTAPGGSERKFQADGSPDSAFRFLNGSGNQTYPYRFVLAGPNSFYRVAIPGQSNGFTVERYFSTGTADVAFGDGGRVQFTLARPAVDLVEQDGVLAVDATGGIALVVSYRRLGRDNVDHVVVRLAYDGTPLDSFDGDGIRPFGTTLPTDTDIVSVAFDATDRLVLAGSAGSLYGDPRVDPQAFIARLNADGSFDDTFDGDGQLTFAPAGASISSASFALPRADGSLAVAGTILPDVKRLAADAFAMSLSSGGVSVAGSVRTTSSVGSFESGLSSIDVGPAGDTYVLARHPIHDVPSVLHLRPDGSRDTSYGDGGFARLLSPNAPLFPSIVRVLAQANGKVLAIGADSDTPSGPYKVALHRLNADGKPDPTFGIDGQTLIDVRSSSYGLAVNAADGGAYLSGQHVYDSSALAGAFFVLKITPSGQLDRAFNGDGIAYLDPLGDYAGIQAINLVNDGLIVNVTGVGTGVDPTKSVLLKLKLDGSLDTAWADNGYRTLSETAYVSVVGQTAGGQFLADVEGDANGRRIVRYTSDGLVDASFGTSPGQTPYTALLPVGARVVRPFVGADGKILLAFKPTGSPGAMTIVRLTRDGTPDTSLGADGQATVDLFPATASFDARWLDTTLDGRVWVAGSVSSPSNEDGDVYVARFTDVTNRSLQAETATLTGGTAKSTQWAGYLGTGYADYGGNNSAVRWTVNGVAAGAGRLEFRYANGATSDRPLRIVVNGVTVGTISFPPTGGWTTWKTATIETPLAVGTNTITAVAGAGGGANVDQLKITNLTAPPRTPVTIQAETATRSGGTAVGTGNKGYTGTGYVNLGPAGNYVQFTANRASGGVTVVKLRYANGSTVDRPLSVSVNGVVKIANVSLGNTGSWTTWKEVTFTLDLVAGVNVIKLTSTTASGANLDSVTVG